MIILLIVSLFASSFLELSAAAAVLELDSNFLNFLDKGPWLVKFYAPWCGYCRKLEPIYEEVAQDMASGPVRVARIDATLYPDVTSQFEVRGYPTLKYIDGNTVFTHSGDRTKDHIIQFAKRSHGPAVRLANSEGRFKEIMEEHSTNTFFFYIGPSQTDFKIQYDSVAAALRLKTYFYEGNLSSIPSRYRPDYPDSEPGVIVFKDSTSFLFTEPIAASSNVSLQAWVRTERFVAFPHVTEIDLYDFIESDKLVVIFVINDTAINSKLGSPENLKFKMVGETIARKRIPELLSHFQLAWMTDIHAAGNLAMTTLRPPSLLVIHPESQVFHLTEEYHLPLNSNVWTEETVLNFLKSIQKGDVKSYGGSGFFAKLKRLGYDFVTGVIEFFVTSPLLALFVMGIPLCVVSFLCYVICCMDTVDDEEDGPDARHHTPKERVPHSQVPLLSGDELKAKSQGEKKTD